MGTMKNSNIKQGVGVCLASRERWQTKEPALPKSIHMQTKERLNQIFLYMANQKRDISSFWGYEWERIENISADKAQKHVTNF